MGKARELVAMQQIDFAVKTLEAAVKELGIEGLKLDLVHIRMEESGRTFSDGISHEKGTRLQEIFAGEQFETHQDEPSAYRPVKEVILKKGKFYVYLDISINQLDKLKAEQEKIAAEIARLEGEQNE